MKKVHIRPDSPIDYGMSESEWEVSGCSYGAAAHLTKKNNVIIGKRKAQTVMETLTNVRGAKDKIV